MFIDLPLKSSVADIEIRGLRLRLRNETSYERYRNRCWEKEPETFRWIDAELSPGDVLYDIGASVGLYAVYAALRVPASRILAFEPGAHSCATLLENVALNRASNLDVYCLPLARRAQLGFLNLSRLEAGSSMHGFERPEIPAAFGENIVARQGCMATTLDGLVKRSLPMPTLLKIDVDGTEDEVLAGARNVLRASSLRSVLVERNWIGALNRGTFPKLERAGFTLLERGPIGHRGQVSWRNYLFRRQ